MALGVKLETAKIPWLRAGTIDATAAGADSALGTTERLYSVVKDLDNVAVCIVPANLNGLYVRFLLITNDADVDIDVWVGRFGERKEEAELARACTLDVVCGQQDHSDGTHHLADTITVTNNKLDPAVVPIVPGTDHFARLKIPDLQGCNLVVFHGYGTFDEDCIVEYSGY